MQLKSFSLGLIGLLAITSAASAQVTNGGFETGATQFGVPTGWTTDAPSLAGVVLDNGSFAIGHGAPGPHTGSWDILLGPNTDDWLTQALATQAGQKYNVSFWLYDATAGANDFSAYWGGAAPGAGQVGSQDNGQQLLNIVNSASFGWTQFTDQVTAATSSTNLTFYGANPSIFFGLDDVSVTVANPSPASGTPEPGGLALLIGLGAAGTGAFSRRNRKQRASSTGNTRS